jgi:hypothetical protein
MMSGGRCEAACVWGGQSRGGVVVLAMWVSVFCLVSGWEVAVAAVYRTENFIVTASTRSLAARVALAAESHRRELSVRWVGHEMPRWSVACRILVRSGHPQASGATTFSFRRGEVFGWQMTLQGPDVEVLESILPHELTHTVFACRFRRPVPRWADEGAAVMAESLAERRRQQRAVVKLLESGRRIVLRDLLRMSEYPADRPTMLALYAEGVSLVRFLVERLGRLGFLEFLESASGGDWDAAVSTSCGGISIEQLEREWVVWALRSPVVRVVGWQSRTTQTPRSLHIVARAQSPQPTAASTAASKPSLSASDRRSWIWRAPDPRRRVR